MQVIRDSRVLTPKKKSLYCRIDHSIQGCNVELIIVSKSDSKINTITTLIWS